MIQLKKIISTSIHRTPSSYSINLGIFEKDGESFPLSGRIYCPFSFSNQIVKENISIIQNAQVQWAIQMEMIPPDDETAKEKLLRYDFVRFALYTTVSYTTDAIDMVLFQDKSLKESVELVQSHFTKPLSIESAIRKTEYLTYLYSHNNWAKKQPNIELIDFVHSLMITSFNTREKISLEREMFDSLTDTTTSSIEKQTKDFNKINSLLNACHSIAEQYYQAFKKLTDNRVDSIGYQDFVDSIQQYFDGVLEEAKNRRDKVIPPSELFNKKRLYTCAVYTVYIAAALESGLKMPKKVIKNTTEDQLRDNFSHLICRFNGLVSSFREKKETNWVFNDLSIIKTDALKRFKVNLSLEDSKDSLYESINEIMADADLLLKRSRPKNLAEIIYNCIIIQWGIGSLPAQLCSERYFADRAEGPYIPEAERDLLKGDFWKFIQ